VSPKVCRRSPDRMNFCDRWRAGAQLAEQAFSGAFNCSGVQSAAGSRSRWAILAGKIFEQRGLQLTCLLKHDVFGVAERSRSPATPGSTCAVLACDVEIAGAHEEGPAIGRPWDC